MIQAILFDMDGVLVNTEPLHYRIWQQVFLAHGLEIDYEGYKGCIGTTYDFLMNLVLENYGKDYRGDDSLKKDFAERKARIIDEEGFPQIQGVVPMIQRMHKAGYKLAVASSSPQQQIKQAMENLKIAEYFTVLNSGENVAHSKPAPDIFLNTAEKLMIEPANCLVVEDSTNGCKAANHAYMHCIGYDNPDSGEQDLGTAIKIITHWDEMTPELVREIV